MRIALVFLCSLLLSSCGASVSIGFGLDQPVTLGVGESVSFRDEDLRVRFLRVDNDSRCPSDVTCVTGGEATVTVEARRASASSALLTLVLPTADTATYQGYEIRLLELEPYPVSTVTPNPAAYEATVVASKP